MTAHERNALLVMTPILPDREDELREILRGFRTAGPSPLARLPRTHEGRWVIVQDFFNDPSQRKPEHLACSYLLFSCHFDGPPYAYLNELCEMMAPEARAIWGCCAGCPPDAPAAALKAYLQHNAVGERFFMTGPFLSASVAEIRAGIALRRRLQDFVYESQGLPPEELQRRFGEEFGS